MTHSPDPLRRAFPAGSTLSRWHAADGWAIRRFDWPAAGQARGTILFQAGRGDIIEKYLEAFGHWHARDWSVTSFDWRGQGGSGRLAADPHVGHADDFGPWIDDLSAIWRDLPRDRPRVLMGHSMGGYLVTQAIVDGVVDPDAAVLVAPMLGLKSPVSARIGGAFARLMCAIGDPARAAWKGNEKPATLRSRQALLTHDAGRYDDELWWYARDPALRLGPPSWAWMAEAFARTRRLAADPRMAGVRVPVLILSADDDGLVDPRAARAAAARLPAAELVRFGPDSAHEILREADPVRDRALAAIDGFLDRHAQPAAA